MYYLPTRIFMGNQALSEAQDHIARLGQKTLIVCGRNSAQQSGALDALVPILKRNQQSYELFSEVSQNPDLHTIMAGKKMLLHSGCDFVTGIGGGSPLDAAKAIAMAAANDLHEEQLYDVSLMRQRFPILAIPTTHGTGSEVTQYSVLSDPKRKKKAGFGTDLAFPDIAILDPLYTLSLSPSITINTSIDALSHLLEGIYSTKRQAWLYPLIAKGISLIMENLSLVLNEPHNVSARSDLQLASMYGGIVIAHSSTTLQHSIGYPITSEFEVPHGLANGMFMRQIMDFNLSAISEEVKHILALAGTTQEEFYAWLLRFPLQVKVPISDAMIEAKIPEIMAARNTLISPVQPTWDELRLLLKSVQKELS